MNAYSLIPAVVAVLALSACAENPVVTSSNIDPISVAVAPPGAAPGTCWGKTISPAVIETGMSRLMLKL